MLRRVLPLLLAPLAALACKRDRTPPVQNVATELSASSSALVPDDLPPLLPQLGPLSFSVAKPGTYVASFRYDRVHFVTTEIVETTHLSGADSLTLGDGGGAGDAYGCFSAGGSLHGSVGAYASSDHKQHDTDTPHHLLLGGRGDWARDAHGWTRVSLALVESCPPPPAIDPVTPRVVLRCVAAVRTGAPAKPALLCDDAGGVLRDAALPLATADAAPWWMWLETTPGAEIAVDDQRSAVTVTFQDVDAGK